MQDYFKDWDGIFKDWTIIKLDKDPKNNQAERDEVLNPCKELCAKLLITGIILKWRRLDAKDMFHENGEPDLEIWLPFQQDGYHFVFILLAECKRKDGGVHSQDQISYMNKYNEFSNTQYELVTSSEQLNYIIRKLSDVKKDMDDFQSFQCKPTIEKPGSDI